MVPCETGLNSTTGQPSRTQAETPPPLSFSDPIEPASLRATGIFAGLDDNALATLAEYLELQRVNSGADIFRQGDAGSVLYLIASGSVQLHKTYGADELCVATIQAGDWFGDVALLAITNRTVTAIAKETCELWALKASDLRRLYKLNLKAYALLMMNLARELARRVQLTENEWIKLQHATNAPTRACDSATQSKE